MQCLQKWTYLDRFCIFSPTWNSLNPQKACQNGHIWTGSTFLVEGVFLGFPKIPRPLPESQDGCIWSWRHLGTGFNSNVYQKVRALNSVLCKAVIQHLDLGMNPKRPSCIADCVQRNQQLWCKCPWCHELNSLCSSFSKERARLSRWSWSRRRGR